MFTGKLVILHMIIILSCVNIVHTTRCSRIPEGSGGKRTPSTGNFRIRLSEDSRFYKPGRQYIGNAATSRNVILFLIFNFIILFYFLFNAHSVAKFN